MVCPGTDDLHPSHSPEARPTDVAQYRDTGRRQHTSLASRPAQTATILLSHSSNIDLDHHSMQRLDVTNTQTPQSLGSLSAHTSNHVSSFDKQTGTSKLRASVSALSLFQPQTLVNIKRAITEPLAEQRIQAASASFYQQSEACLDAFRHVSEADTETGNSMSSSITLYPELVYGDTLVDMEVLQQEEYAAHPQYPSTIIFVGLLKP